MGKDDFWELLTISGAAILIGSVIKQVLENKGIIFRCPRCNYPVNGTQKCCPNCGQVLKW